MQSMPRLCLLTLLAFAAATIAARAQEPPTPAPVATSNPTFMDRQYDGRWHVMLAPYVWGPTIKANFQYQLPTLRHHLDAGPIANTIQVGPSDYLPKLNTAGMLAFDVRKGEFDLFGDAIYLNASTTATIFSTLGGNFGKIHIPVTIDSSAHVTTAIWEVAAGYAVAHGHNADLTLLAGIREFPIAINADYTATIGKRGILAPTGTINSTAYTNDVIVGLKGRAFFGGDRWYVPYYIDVGTGNNNQSWEAYGGAGYAFPHGQTLIALWRALNYNAFPPISPVQKMSLAGPLLGYTFNL
jgi:hypothetical protein